LVSREAFFVTNLRLLLAIGIPSLLIILSWIELCTRMSRMESKLRRSAERIAVVQFDQA
jgi:hypothetical protein